MIGLCLCFIGLVASVSADPATELAEATRTYDLERARALVVTFTDSDDTHTVSLRVTAHLLVAELLRMEFSYLPEAESKARRALGQEIDAAAEAGLEQIDKLPESSEKYRLKADLLGTKIRSNYRAGKLKGPLNSAIKEALRQDPKNAHAYVTKAKTLIFRPSPSKEELRGALDLLETADSLDKDLEQGRLLAAYAHMQMGETRQATELWQQCLRENPDCVPAARELEPHQNQ